MLTEPDNYNPFEEILPRLCAQSSRTIAWRNPRAMWRLASRIAIMSDHNASNGSGITMLIQWISGTPEDRHCVSIAQIVSPSC